MKFKKFLSFCLIAGCVVGAGVFYYFSVGDVRVRHQIKAKCSDGLDCECFANVVDNRLSSDELHIFLNFMNTLSRRSGASILEFCDETTGRRILSIVSVCAKQQTNSKKETK